MPRWPKPPPEPQEVAPPSGEAPDAPSLLTLEDGSRWLWEDGGWRQVAPPGTDTHELRWVHRGLPATNVALRRAAELPDSGRTRHDRQAWAEAIDDVDAAAEGDDIALLRGAEHVAYHALRRAVREDIQPQELRQHWRAVSLLRSATERARRRLSDPAGMDEAWEATARWRQGT